MNKPRKRKLPPHKELDHTMVRELVQLRHEKGILIADKRIAERGRDEAREEANKTKAASLNAVAEYKQRLDRLLAFVKKEAPELHERLPKEVQYDG